MPDNSTQRWPMAMGFLTDEPNHLSVATRVVVHGWITHGFACTDADVIAPSKCDRKIETDRVDALTNERG